MARGNVLEVAIAVETNDMDSLPDLCRVNLVHRNDWARLLLYHFQLWNTGPVSRNAFLTALANGRHLCRQALRDVGITTVDVKPSTRCHVFRAVNHGALKRCNDRDAKSKARSRATTSFEIGDENQWTTREIRRKEKQSCIHEAVPVREYGPH